MYMRYNPVLRNWWMMKSENEGMWGGERRMHSARNTSMCRGPDVYSRNWMLLFGWKLNILFGTVREKTGKQV